VVAGFQPALTMQAARHSLNAYKLFIFNGIRTESTSAVLASLSPATGARETPCHFVGEASKPANQLVRARGYAGAVNRS